MADPQFAPELHSAIERCAVALSDGTRLKTEVKRLKATGHDNALFAAALFELELARQGDPEVRGSLTELAEVLLRFWRDGSGDGLAHSHAALQTLWLSVAPMLVQFELRQFDQALQTCWQHRQDPTVLAEAIGALKPPGNKRVEFARCLYHLELARQGVDSSRAEFARRAGLLGEAYQDNAFANDLVGHDAGLLHLWGELKPYLDEFFEGLEEQAAKLTEETGRIRMPRREAKTDPHLPAPPPPPPSAPRAKPALGETREVPSFRTLTKQQGGKTAETPALPPAPPQTTPPGSWIPDADVEEGFAPPPPPPPDLTPPGAWKPPQRTPSGEVEIVEVEVDGPPAPPPPPRMTPAKGTPLFVEVEDIDYEPDEAALVFWEYTFASLQLGPAEGRRARMLSTATRADRKRLTEWLGGLPPHLDVPEAKAFGALVRLMLAGETKEKTLFGGPNPRRKEALEGAFDLLGPHPQAAGHAAVWFELDGKETQLALSRGLELLMPFLAYCSRNSLDPLRSESISTYLEG